MPGKVNCGVDYDDDYGDTGEFGDDYDCEDDYEELLEKDETKFASGSPEIKVKQGLLRTEVWLCPICAFDNEDSTSSCYICGVLRNPLRKINSSSCIGVGRLLHLLGQISEKEMHKYEMEAKQQGKGSFAYVWALDESVEERERCITMSVVVAFFKSRRYHVVLLDSPGHRDFVPNMITGATQAMLQF